MQFMKNPFVGLVVYTAVVYATAVVSKQVKVQPALRALGKFLMNLPRVVMMILMAIPEQSVLAIYEPKIPLFDRLMVSVAMYAIHFAWNGMAMKPDRSYNELVWICGTALYAYYVVGVKMETAVALIAADSVMTLSLRDLV